MSAPIYRRPATFLCAGAARDGTLNPCSTRGDFSTGTGRRYPRCSCTSEPRGPLLRSGARLLCEAGEGMVREPEEPTQQKNAEPAMTIETKPRPDIDDLRHEIDRLDAAILAAVKRRAEVSQEIGRARMASGGTRLVHRREMKVIERYSELGPEGKDLAMLLLRLGRGHLGR